MSGLKLLSISLSSSVGIKIDHKCGKSLSVFEMGTMSSFSVKMVSLKGLLQELDLQNALQLWKECSLLFLEDKSSEMS